MNDTISGSPSASKPKRSAWRLPWRTRGQFIKAALTLSAKDDGPQPIGSAISFGKRYHSPP